MSDDEAEQALRKVRQELWVDYCLAMGRTDCDPAPFNARPHIRIIDEALGPGPKGGGMNAETLLPCPFCGSKAGLGVGNARKRDEYAFVNCTECHASTNVLTASALQFTDEEAAAAWNNRAPIVGLTFEALWQAFAPAYQRAEVEHHGTEPTKARQAGVQAIVDRLAGPAIDVDPIPVLSDPCEEIDHFATRLIEYAGRAGVPVAGRHNSFTICAWHGATVAAVLASWNAKQRASYTGGTDAV